MTFIPAKGDFTLRNHALPELITPPLPPAASPCKRYKNITLSKVERCVQLGKVFVGAILGFVTAGFLFLGSKTLCRNMETWFSEFQTGKRVVEVFCENKRPPNSEKTNILGRKTITPEVNPSTGAKSNPSPVKPLENTAKNNIILPNTIKTLPSPTVTTSASNPVITDASPEQTLASQLAAVKALGILSAENFSQHAQLVLNHFYKKPMPAEKDVTVPDLQGKMVVWKDLSVKEKEDIIKANKKGANSSLFLKYEGPNQCRALVPRWSHGCMHICRATMEINLIAQMYKKYDPSFSLTDKDILLAQYLTIFHDSARQAEGVDVWDDLSAENARNYLEAMGFEEDKINQAIDALKTKDNPDASKRGPIARLVQGGDCLDIMRIYGTGFKDFRLDMYNDLKDKKGFLEDYKKLKEELYDFIKCTEQPLLKTLLEGQSTDYYREVIGLVNYKEKKKLVYPFLQGLLQQQIGKLPKASHQARFAAHSDKYWPIKTADGITVVKPLKSIGKAGVNDSYIVADEAAKLFFWKVGDEYSQPAETGASQMANFITGGLVPVAVKKSFQPDKKGETLKGSMQPYVEMKKGAFSPKETAKKFDAAKLNERQREQLFAHMIADRLVSNYDTHSGQFRIDLQGNVIGFDKGQAFKYYGKKALSHFKKNEPAKFDPFFFLEPLDPNKPTYSTFAQYLKQNPLETQRILKSTIVNETFTRCKQMSKEQIKGWLNDYADVATEGKKEDFIKDIYDRTKNIEGEILEYFSCIWK